MSDSESDLLPEQVYLASCCEQRVWEPLAHGVDRSMFVMATRAFDMINSHVASHGVTPPLQLLARMYPGFQHVPDVNLLWAAGQVQQEAQKRGLLQVADDAMLLLETGDVHAAAAVMAGARDVVIPSGGVYGTPVTDRSLFDPVDVSNRIKVPDDALQGMTDGIGHGDYWVLAARLKTGKTFTLMRHAVSACDAGYDAIFLSLEMPKQQIAERLHALILGSWVAPASPDERCAAVSEWFAQRGSTLTLLDKVDHPMVTPATVGRYCKPGRLVVVDYIGLMSPAGNVAKNSADWSVMQQISRDLRSVTLSTGGALLTAAQLNRQAGKSPDVIHIAETDSIARDADVVVIMERPDGAPVAKYTLAANRHGYSGGTWYTKFVPELPQFAPLAQGDYSRAIEAAKQDPSRR